MEYWNDGVMKSAQSIRRFQLPGFRILRILLPALLAVTAGCTALRSTPRLSADAQAEALACFSQALLAEAGGDSAVALERLQRAVLLDPDAEIIYGPAVATALKLNRPEEALRLARQLRRQYPDTLTPRLLQARVFALTDQPVPAEEAFKQAVTAFPQEMETHLYLARFYIAQQQRAEAIQVLEAVREQHGKDPDVLNLLGTLYVDRARDIPDAPQAVAAIEEGIALLEQALEIDPSDPRRWQQLGYARLAVKQTDKALSAFEQAHALAPGDLLIARQLLELTIQTGNPSRALEIYDRMARQTGTDPERWLQTIAEQLSAEQRPLLIEYLDGFIREHSQPAVFYYAQLSALYLDGKQTEEAEAVLRDGLAQYPDDPRLRTVLGYLKLQQEHYEEAYGELEQVRSRADDPERPFNPFFVFNYLIAAQKSGHLEQAADILSEAYPGDPVILNQYMQALLTGETPVSVPSAIELMQAFRSRNPEVPEPLYYLAVLQSDQKDYTEALQNSARFEALARSGGQTNLLNGFFYYQYAALHERNGQLEEAEKLFRKAIALDQTTAASARNYIAYMWAERGEKLDMALALVQQALAEDPENGAFLDTLGWIYYMQGRYAEALEQLQKAKTQVGDDPTVWEHLGDTYLKLNDRSAAVEHWKKALEMDPGDEQLVERLRAAGISSDKFPAAADDREDTPPRP
jgi:tetratricopeptide (TPR) repeat protein